MRATLRQQHNVMYMHSGYASGSHTDTPVFKAKREECYNGSRAFIIIMSVKAGADSLVPHGGNQK